MISASTNTAFDRLCAVGELHDSREHLRGLEERLAAGTDLYGTPITASDREFLNRAIAGAKERVERAKKRVKAL